MPVLGDPPMLGKQRHPGRVAYYIVIPRKSLIFRGFGEVHLAVLQSASLRITCKRTHFRHFATTGRRVGCAVKFRYFPRLAQ